MESRQRLMSAVVAMLAVVAVPLRASAKNHNNNYPTYPSPAASSARTFNTRANNFNTRSNNFTAFKSTPSTSNPFHQAASTNGFFGPANRNAFWNRSTASNTANYYLGANRAWNNGLAAVNTPGRYYGNTPWNSGVSTPVYDNNYATTIPAYGAPSVPPIYYRGGYNGYPSGYAAAPYTSYPAYGGGYGYGGGPCGNPYTAEKHQYNFTKLMNERQNLQYQIGQSRSYGNWSNAHRLNTQLEYVNEQLGNFHNSCGASAGPMTTPTTYSGNGYGYNGYNKYGGYNSYGSPYAGGGMTSMVPFLSNFIH